MSEDFLPAIGEFQDTKPPPLNSSRRAATGSSLRGITSNLFRRDTSPVPEHGRNNGDTRGPLGLTTLHEPDGTQCVVDIIFVHGLGGGSRKTWSAAPTEDAFWPKSWLPQDPDFKEARVHTYGYNSDWGKRAKSILSIEDFAQELLATISNHPVLRRSRSHIVLVGHSMGGCVAKRVYTLARENTAYEELASRFHSLFFLGTPHRGSNLALVLRNVLQFAWGSKPFVDDLAPDSSILTAMNDEFRAYANDLRLWSFFETLPMSGLNKLVVDKVSATLGFGNEEVSFMDADHRNVCKFHSQEDPNYQKLRNSLSNAVDQIKSENRAAASPGSATQAHVSNPQSIRKFLGLADNDSLENDLALLDDFKIPGSCLWFTETPTFNAWKSRKAKSSPILWLTGRPGAGKSVLCAHVLEHLRQNTTRCSYYIFKHGKAGTRSIASLLISLAYQMAIHDSQILSRLRQLEEENVSWDSHDDRAIWRKLFVAGIFKLDSISTHYWVIDALDEGVKFSNFFKLLPQLPEGLRIFITSRSVLEIDRGIASLGSLVTNHPLTSDDTHEDLRQYVNSKLDETLHEDAGYLVERILEKANGSFLWTRLVIQDLEMSYTEEDVNAVLTDVPEDLFEVYERILRSIENDKRRARLAKSIFTWVCLSSRPLSVKELQQAVKLDINEMLQPAEKAIVTICGQFVFIDPNSRVQLIHETARAFLLSDTLTSNLAVAAPEGHSHLAVLCLQYLNTYLKHHQFTRLPSLRSRIESTSDTALMPYATFFFSDHIHKSDTEDLRILAELRKLLDGALLFLIEHHARSGNLEPVTHIAMNLGSYLGRLSKHVPPTEKNRQVVESWIIDMIRICAKFQTYLLGCPSSIHLLLPGLCPTDSAIARQYTSPATISVKGLRDTYWDDCLMRLDFQGGFSTAVGHGERYFAVGRSNGDICIYDMISLQSCIRVQQSGRVWCLEFGSEDRFLASSSKDSITIWDPKTAAVLKRFDGVHALALRSISERSLLLATKSNSVMSIHLGSDQVDELSLAEANFNSTSFPSQLPTLAQAAFSSSDFGMLALAYRSHPILLVDIDTGQFLGQCAVGFNNGVNAMVFNPRVEISALVVAYTEGNLAVFDLHTFTCTFLASHVYSNALACSSDGRSLVSGSNDGLIEIFEFAGSNGNTLELIHRINTNEPNIRGVAFSSDGLRFVNISPNRCRVWEPATLVRRDADWMSSSDLSTLAPLPPRTSTTGMLETSATPEVAAIDSLINENTVICGEKDGDVVMYSTQDGSRLGRLYSHGKGVAVVSVASRQAEALVASVDDSARVLVSQFTKTLPHWSLATVRLDKRFEGAVSNLLLSPDCRYILVTGRTVDQVWDLSNGATVGQLSWTENTHRTVLEHPQRPECIMIVNHQGTIRSFKWSNLEEVDSEKMEYACRGDTDEIHKHHVNQEWFVEVSKTRDDRRVTQVQFHPWSRLSGHGEQDEPTATWNVDTGLSSMVRDVIALKQNRLFFLNVDLWLCSLDLATFTKTKLVHRHFFILPDWLNTSGRPLCVMDTKGDFVFANRYGITTVAGGLEFVESISVADGGDWRVTSGSMHRRTSLATSMSPAVRPGMQRKVYSVSLRSGIEPTSTHT